MKTFHLQATTRYIAERIAEDGRRGELQGYVARDGQAISNSDAIAHIEDMERQGLKFIPCCEYCDAAGECQGNPDA